MSDVEAARLALAELLRAERDSIVAEWLARVRRDPRVPRAGALSDDELRDHSPVLLEEVADALEGRDAPAERHDAASQHGAQRAGHGYDIRAVVREMALLRDVVNERIGAADLITSGAPAQMLHGIFDDAIAASVERMEASSRAVIERERAEAQRARERAERADADKDLFVAIIAHELRTPLSAMVGWVALARERVRGDALLARAIETLERNLGLQRRLVDDLLDLARVRSGKLSLDLRRVDLRRVIEGAAESARPIAAGRGVEVTTSALAPVFVDGDADRLAQVITNLLSNAVKFTAPGGRVEVRMTRAGDVVRVDVSDDGAGIAPEVRDSIFEPFHQGDPLAGTRGGGLGIGLAIVREVVQAHGGRVGVESEGVGKGATFWVELPVAPVRR